MDDPYGARLFNEVNQRKYSYSIEHEADYQAKDLVIKATQTQFNLIV